MTWADLGIVLPHNPRPQEKVVCPKCSGDRRNKTDKCLSVNTVDMTYNCHHCGWHGGIKAYQKPEKVYTIPVWTNTTALPDNVVKWFADRKITQKTLNEMSVGYGPEFMPQFGKAINVIQFPYFLHKKVVNIKYRGHAKDPDKKVKKIFKMVKDAQLVFYNMDSVIDATECLIVEGEPDALSFIEAGYDKVISVPNGASKGNQKLEYLDNCWQYFENKTKIYIGTDNDEAGIALRNELIRRLGDERCLIVDYKDCKDGNEYLVKHGAIELLELVNKAKPVPIEGIFLAEELSADVVDMYENGLPPGLKIGLGDFDKLLSFVPGQLTTITGMPGSGKSEYLDYMCQLLAVKYGWKFGVFSPENFPIKLHISKLTEKLIGKRFGKRKEDDTEDNTNRLTPKERDRALGFINDHFFFIRPSDENYSLDNVLAMIRKLILKYGINGAIIDPWNSIEHQIPPGVSETSFINNQLAKIYSFKQRYNIHLFLIAHPTKMQKDKKTKTYEVPTLYTISGSAHFYNRTDNGISVYRNFVTKRTDVYVQKVKFKHLGKIGDVSFLYHWDTGRYNPEGLEFDTRNHLDVKDWSQSLPVAVPTPPPPMPEFNDELPF